RRLGGKGEQAYNGAGRGDTPAPLPLSAAGMHFLDLTLPGALANLALDEPLLLGADAGGGEVLRLWERPRPAVVRGAGSALREDADEEACAADGVPLLRRASGGGTVLLGSGCLLFSLVLSYERDPRLAEVRP